MRILDCGVKVILDFGFWNEKTDSDWGVKNKAAGCASRTIFFQYRCAPNCPAG
jgi:hypothetical protein